tara:strand:+ start:198 stop:596 length:399 start_codon:yes stop_codon:yes gene_type:complete
MIEANEPTNGTVVKQETPKKITTSQIIKDLENGIDRTGIQTKYNLETWEVKQMFMHPSLKGKKAKKVRKLSFDFVDDTLPLNSGDIAVEQTETIDPNQTSIPVQVEDTLDEGPQIIESFDEDFVDNSQLTQL